MGSIHPEGGANETPALERIYAARIPKGDLVVLQEPPVVWSTQLIDNPGQKAGSDDGAACTHEVGKRIVHVVPIMPLFEKVQKLILYFI